MEHMLRTIFFLIVVAVCLILSLPLMLISSLTRDKDEFGPMPGITKWIASKIVPFVAKLGGCNVTIKGKENLPDGPVLLVGNHQGDFDVLLILFAFGEIPVIVAKKEAKKVPIAATWMKMIHCIFMDRKDMRQSLMCIKKTGDYLEHGFKTLVFPEGTRSQGPEMGEFKPGAFKAAIKTKTPIVPFVIDGTYKVFEKQRYLKKADVTLSILRPIQVSGDEKTQEISDTVKGMIQNELDRIRINRK